MYLPTTALVMLTNTHTIIYNVRCPFCKHYHDLESFPFTVMRWEFHECNNCQQWFSYHIVKFKEYIITFNVVQGFYDERD